MIQQDLITKTLAVFSPKAAMTRMADQARLRNFGRFDSALDSTKRGISAATSLEPKTPQAQQNDIS
jgi:hypothetical protein